MAVLRNNQSNVEVRLRARHLVGRSPGVDLLVDVPQVSREHASIAWVEGSWQVRDLGSRNGTWVQGHKIDAGDDVELQLDQSVAFGREDAAWTLVDDHGPELAAVHGDTWIEAQDGLLMLPSPEDPDVVVHHEPGHGWVIERDDALETVQDGEVIIAGRRLWTLAIPRITATTMNADAGRSIDTASLEFAVSADEEYVELTVRMAGDIIKLAPRAHHYTLLTLARARLRDATSGGTRAEHGWVYTAELQRMLRASSSQLYVNVHRARREFEELELLGAQAIVQRRATTRQVRIGVADLTVRRL